MFYLYFTGLVRDFPDAQKEFTNNDGFSVLMRAMQQDVEKLKIKAAFMLSAVCNNTPAYKGTVIPTLTVTCCKTASLKPFRPALCIILI